ncbi:uncharacterized protein LOC114033344 isoform X3 [Vombatus ursinus]|uniref:uncharacterized protein LOC114033344 isoform X3 n=1 Tax=Vombatus ursinus TaxID=29139 RepID=UPI000FFCFAAC|nr:uncharacterized protein LOC114033344 isoform X3 [Vombatus ursinus]
MKPGHFTVGGGSGPPLPLPHRLWSLLGTINLTWHLICGCCLLVHLTDVSALSSWTQAHWSLWGRPDQHRAMLRRLRASGPQRPAGGRLCLPPQWALGEASLCPGRIHADGSRSTKGRWSPSPHQWSQQREEPYVATPCGSQNGFEGRNDIWTGNDKMKMTQMPRANEEIIRGYPARWYSG